MSNRYFVALQKVAVARDLSAIVCREVRPGAIAIVGQDFRRGQLCGASSHRRRTPALVAVGAVGYVFEIPEV